MKTCKVFISALRVDVHYNNYMLIHYTLMFLMTSIDPISAHGGLVHVVMHVNSALKIEGITSLVKNSPKLQLCVLKQKMKLHY